jgi:hypothetical protein
MSTTGDTNAEASGARLRDDPVFAPATRLEPPLTRSALVCRDGLFDQLSDDRSGKVVLVCAPAGSGKTVLVRSWIESAKLTDRTAWVSVERDERDVQRFCLYVIDALAGALGTVHRVDPSPEFRGTAVLDQLLHELASLEEPALLVVDDLHELQSAQPRLGGDRRSSDRYERALNDLWWLTLINGILMMVLAFWVSGQFFLGRAYTLLMFAGIWALITGITAIVRAFQIRGLVSE